MNSTDILIMIATLLGGLTFFLFGMNVMSGGLEKMAGGKLERTMKKVTSNDIFGFSVGAGITIAIQSSSAMTVMLVGLVNSGIMTFGETYGMIMGSHVGTTLTAWILTLTGISGENFFLTILKPMTFAPILAFVGIAMKMLSKNDKKHSLGDIMIGFAVLMSGMDMMSSSMIAVRQYSGLLTAFSSPIIAFLISTVFTGVIQSSAATVAIVQALALAAVSTANPITYQMAIPLVIGANIGTCMTALLSSIGTNRQAKGVVAMHIYTNAIGGVVCMIAMYIAMMFSPDLFAKPIGIIGVALVHSLFNILNTILFIPFKKPLIRLCDKSIGKEKGKQHTVFLDERLFSNTPLALSECQRLGNEMAEYTRDALQKSIKLLTEFNSEIASEIKDLEQLTDKYEDKLGTYLVRLSNNELSENESHLVGRLLHSIGDLERISDHALNICRAAEEINEKEFVFSKRAIEELNVISSAVCEIVDITIESFLNNDSIAASHVEPLEQVIDGLKNTLKSTHISRLQSGECTIELGFVFSDIISNYERISDHCSNIAVFTMQLPTDMLDAHKYLNAIKNSEKGAFIDDYNMYSEKYKIYNV